MKAYMMRVIQKSIYDESHSRKAYMKRVFPEKHA
jgi:hypothetical protein